MSDCHRVEGTNSMIGRVISTQWQTLIVRWSEWMGDGRLRTNKVHKTKIWASPTTTNTAARRRCDYLEMENNERKLQPSLVLICHPAPNHFIKTIYTLSIWLFNPSHSVQAHLFRGQRLKACFLHLGCFWRTFFLCNRGLRFIYVD